MTGPRTELLLTGEELVTGKVSDSNGPFLAVRLARMGLPCSRLTLVGDGGSEIISAAREALARANLVIVSGGLGPTGDDVTRPALAEALERPLHTPDPLPGCRPGAAPKGAVQIDNLQGSAPGFWMDTGTAVLAALPGVPWELEAMWPELEERIRGRFPNATRHARTLRTVGCMEKELDARVSEALAGLDGITWGVTANPLAVDLHLTTVDADTLETATARVRQAVGDAIYAEGDVPLAQVVGEHLRKKGWKVATAESCTGGAISAALTAIPGASDYVERAVVSYTNVAKVEALGVSEVLIEQHGAVSDPVARAMAEGLKKLSGADVVLSVTGIAGPTGGTPDKPVGTVYMAVCDLDGTFCRRFTHTGDRARFVLRTVHRGLDLLRHAVSGGTVALEARFPPE